jgi:hypothetical protein
MRIFDLIEELPDIIGDHFDVLNPDYREEKAFDAARAFSEHLAMSYEVRFVLINTEGQIDSTTLYEDQEEAEKVAGDRCMVATLLAESFEAAPKPPPFPLNKVMEEAQDAFWEVIVKRFPEAKTGDLSPERTVAFDEVAKHAIEEWVRNNVPAKATGGAA